MPSSVPWHLCCLITCEHPRRNVEGSLTRSLSSLSAFSTAYRERGVRLSTKVVVYKAVVITTLLYGCESWITYRHHVRSLDQFHMRCLRHIARIKWQDKIPNTEMQQRCGTFGIEAFVIKAQLRWVGHVRKCQTVGFQRLPFMLSCRRALGPTVDHYCVSKTI